MDLDENETKSVAARARGVENSAAVVVTVDRRTEAPVLPWPVTVT